MQLRVARTDAHLTPSTNLEILKAIALRRNINSRELQHLVFISRSQLLRRLKYLEQNRLIVRPSFIPGKTYRYQLSPSIKTVDIERLANQGSTQGRDLAARQALRVTIRAMCEALSSARGLGR